MLHMFLLPCVLHFILRPPRRVNHLSDEGVPRLPNDSMVIDGIWFVP